LRFSPISAFFAVRYNHDFTERFGSCSATPLVSADKNACCTESSAASGKGSVQGCYQNLRIGSLKWQKFPLKNLLHLWKMYAIMRIVSE
jgi:hypothetical protein